MDSNKIVTLTMNPAIDKSTEVDHVTPGRKLRCGSPRREPGGGGINVSRALNRLEGSSRAYFTAGGPTGDILLDLLDEEDVDCVPLETGAWTRENLMVRESADESRQYRFDMPGSTVKDCEWEGCLERLESLDPAPDYLVASGSLPPGVPTDFYARLAERIGGGDIRMVLDTSGEALKEGLDGGIFLTKPNLRELEELTGQEVGDGSSTGSFEDNRIKAARELVDDGRTEAVLVSMGSAGALLVTKSESTKISTPTVPIRSRVGAGDSMVAGLVKVLIEGANLQEAARSGVAAGAAAVMTPGSELCRKEDAENLLEEVIAS